MTTVAAGRVFADVDSPPDEGWAVLALPPGERDLGCPDVWRHSLARSRRRRELPRRGPIAKTGAARISAALAVATLVAPAAGGAAAQAASPATVSIGSLQFGSRGPGVAAVQRALGIAADGIFGPQTRAAVKAFQRGHGLVADGVVGPRTAATLGVSSALSMAGTSSGTTRTAAPAAAVSLTREQTMALQRALGVTADGVFGPHSQAALRSYEARHGLPADGRPDTAVLRALGISTTTTAPSATTGDSTETTAVSSPSSGVAAAVAAARSKVGDPYAYGGTGPSAFDCSGLTMYAMRAAGIALPHSSYAQYGMGTAVPHGGLQAGDLVFFDTAGPGASDVGIATGPTTAISATTHGVMEHAVYDGYWGSHFVGARRIA